MIRVRSITPAPRAAVLRWLPALFLLFWLGCASGTGERNEGDVPGSEPTRSERGSPDRSNAGPDRAEPGSTAPAPEENTAAGAEGKETAASEPDGDADEASDEKPARKRRIRLDTVYDDRRVGDEESRAVAGELGLVNDEALEAYVHSVAVRLLRYAPHRPFEYEFKIVDQTVPNAFALPGGKIFVSRGLLAFVQSEDELAGVLGHEIIHAAERHASARIDHASRLNPFIIGYKRAAMIAEYSRDQERDADRGGQILAAKAGYDPMGIATFLRKLDASERYEIGWSRMPFFLATHPTSPERSALAIERGSHLDWQRVTGVAHDVGGYYGVVDGLVIGDDPAGGIFKGNLFVHPDMGIQIRFPRGWATQNTPRAVVAVSPRRDAQAVLEFAGSGENLADVVDDFLAREQKDFPIRIRERQEIQVRGLAAIRIEGRTRGLATALTAQMTFIAHEGSVYRLMIVSLPGSAHTYRGRARAFSQSFRPLDEKTRREVEVTRLRVVRTLPNETLEDVSARNNNSLELVYTGVLNDTFASVPLKEGTPIKLGVAEPYRPDPFPDPKPNLERPGTDPLDPENPNATATPIASPND